MLFNKKGQGHMTETVAVLFIFFVLVLFGMIFYFKYAQGEFEKEKGEQLGRRAIEASLQTLFLPEVLCTDGENEPKDNCIDMVKLQHASDMIKENEDYYFDLFSYGKISVFQNYPLPAGETEPHEIVLYEKRKPNAEAQEASLFVVALRDLIQGGAEDYYGYGYMKVVVYQ